MQHGTLEQRQQTRNPGRSCCRSRTPPRGLRAILAPSRASTSQSPRQERASKRAAQGQPTQHHTATGIRGHRASPAGSGAMARPTNTGAVGIQLEQPPGTAQPHREPARSPRGSPQPLTPPVAPVHGPGPAASQAAATQAHPEPRLHNGTPDRPAAGPAYTPPDIAPHTGTHRYHNGHHHRPALRHRAPPHPRPHRGPNLPGSGNVRRGGPTGHDARRTGAPAAPRPTNQADGAAGRAAISRSPSPRPGPRPGPGTRRRPGGRPTARGPGKPTQAAAHGGRPRARGNATDER